MNILDQFTDDVTEIDIHYQNVLGDLDFSYNKITSLDNFTNSLIELDCSHNKITSLDNLRS